MVTVVIPTYNRPDLLPAAIESVLRQTYQDFRLIVSDNASTDATASVVRRYDDPRLVYTHRRDHVGLNEHYNAFTAAVDTKYMFIVPDDDRLLPDALDALVPVLEQYPNAGIVHGCARLVDSAGKIIAPSHDMTGLDRDWVEPGAQFIAKAIRASHRVHGSTVLFRTEAIKPLALDLRDFPATEFGLWLRMALDWDIAFVATTVAEYRIHASTYTSQNARVAAGGYIQGPNIIENIYRVKLRFLEQNAARLKHVNRLRRDARRALRAQLVNFAGHATIPDRRLLKTMWTLARCARRDWRVLVEPGAWRLLAGSVLGRRLVEQIKRGRLERAAAR